MHTNKLSEPIKKLGLIAGQGRLPFLVADGARSAGIEVICVGFKDQAEPEEKMLTEIQPNQASGDGG